MTGRWREAWIITRQKALTALRWLKYNFGAEWFETNGCDTHTPPHPIHSTACSTPSTFLISVSESKRIQNPEIQLISDTKKLCKSELVLIVMVDEGPRQNGIEQFAMVTSNNILPSPRWGVILDSIGDLQISWTCTMLIHVLENQSFYCFNLISKICA